MVNGMSTYIYTYAQTYMNVLHICMLQEGAMGLRRHMHYTFLWPTIKITKLNVLPFKALGLVIL